MSVLVSQSVGDQVFPDFSVHRGKAGLFFKDEETAQLSALTGRTRLINPYSLSPPSVSSQLILKV